MCRILRAFLLTPVCLICWFSSLSCHFFVCSLSHAHHIVVTDVSWRVDIVSVRSRYYCWFRYSHDRGWQFIEPLRSGCFRRAVFACLFATEALCLGSLIRNPNREKVSHQMKEVLISRNALVAVTWYRKAYASRDFQWISRNLWHKVLGFSSWTRLIKRWPHAWSRRLWSAPAASMVNKITLNVRVHARLRRIVNIK